MPRFNGKPPRRGNNLPAQTPLDGIPRVTEPRCHVCTSPDRDKVERLIAHGTSASEIGRLFTIDRRSVSNHTKEHLDWENAAIRKIIEDEAHAAEIDLEEGVKGVLSRRVYLQVALKKALEDLLNGEAQVEPKDALAIITYLDKLETQTEGAAIDELRVQFNAFVQAIREIAPPEQWQRILDRTREILDLTIDAPALQPPENS